MTGIDYAFSPHPPIAALTAAKVSFVARYLSAYPANDTNGKNLLAGEKNALLAAGIAIVVVAEEGAGRMKSGHPAGVTDGTHARTVTKALGMATIPVYFACDFDATPADQIAIDAYLDGAASVIGHARTGIYGGYWPVKRALDDGKATYAWQTVAWSGGQWDTRANLRQGLQITVGGVTVDVDHAMTADFGQWPRPAAPVPPPRPVVEVTTDGTLSLHALAASRHVQPSSVLRLTAAHDGLFPADVAAYVNAVFAASTLAMPAGLKLWTH